MLVKNTKTAIIEWESKNEVKHWAYILCVSMLAT